MSSACAGPAGSQFPNAVVLALVGAVVAYPTTLSALVPGAYVTHCGTTGHEPSWRSAWECAGFFALFAPALGIVVPSMSCLLFARQARLGRLLLYQWTGSVIGLLVGGFGLGFLALPAGVLGCATATVAAGRHRHTESQSVGAAARPTAADR